MFDMTGPKGGVITSGGGFSRRYARPAYQEKLVRHYLEKSGVKMPPEAFYNRCKRTGTGTGTGTATRGLAWAGAWMSMARAGAGAESKSSKYWAVKPTRNLLME